MSSDEGWVNKYREEHESDEQWQLRRAFMLKWKNNYPEERLLCLARVFTNIEFMGCRYPAEVMQEVARLSRDIAKDYRSLKKTKLQRTFVSASDAAENRVKGVKRKQAGVVVKYPAKPKNINFVPERKCNISSEDIEENGQEETAPVPNNQNIHKKTKYQARNGEDDTSDDEYDAKRDKYYTETYVNEMMEVPCLSVRQFNEGMFETEFGRFVLFIRPWSNKFCNIISSCRVCKVHFKMEAKATTCRMTLNDIEVASATGSTKSETKNLAATILWDKLRHQVISLMIKDKWMADGPSRISMEEMAKGQYEFGTPVEQSVAIKMMKLMGWKGGGLGAANQGISEPIKPNFQMVKRAGLGGGARGLPQLRRAGAALMGRFLAASSLDVDLVFSEEFSSQERAELHKCASRAGLASRSHGAKGGDRFLVVSKKLNPFELVSGVVANGGDTPKYRVYIPAAITSSLQNR